MATDNGIKSGNNPNLYDVRSGRLVGFIDLFGKEQLYSVDTATIDLNTLLGVYPGDPNAAFQAAYAAAASLLANAGCSRVIIDGQGRDIYVPAPGIILPAQMANVTWRRFKLIAQSTTLGAEWLEDDATDIAFWNKYQTVTTDGKVWSLRKPILTLLGQGNGLRLEDIYVDGKGTSSVRRSAGIRFKGTNNSDSKLKGGKVVDVESYAVFCGSDTQNTGAIDIEDYEVKPNGTTTNADPKQERTSYGFVCASNDQHWVGVVGSNAHAPLLVTEKGATTFFVDFDFFNGASWDPTPYPHRNIEYRGNSCTFSPGRLGNGQIHLFAHDAVFGPAKIGVTNSFTPPSLFVVYATQVNDDLANLLINFGNEVPFALKSGMKWFSFVATGGNTWAINTTVLASLDGYLQTIPSGKNSHANGTDTQRIMKFHSAAAAGGGFLAVYDKDSTKNSGYGIVGDSPTVFIDDVAKWNFGGDDVKPAADAGGTTTAPTGANIGSPNKRVAKTYSVLLYFGDGTRLMASGAGTPEGAVTAPSGSIFLRTNGAAGTTLYVKESGSGNTGWVGK